jgi:hypothetical protein
VSGSPAHLLLSYLWIVTAALGGWLGQAMLGQWWSGAASGVWGGVLGAGAAACLRRTAWRPGARWAGALLLLVGGFFLLVVAAGFLAAVLGFYRSVLPLSISPSHLVAPQVAIAC